MEDGRGFHGKTGLKRERCHPIHFATNIAASPTT